MTSFIERELRDFEDPDTTPHLDRKRTVRSIFCTQLAKGIFIALIVAILVPTLTYFFVISRNVPDNDEDAEQYYCLILEEFRIPCGNLNISQNECEIANCCFNETTRKCHHYLPSKYYYRLKSDGTYRASQSSSPVGSVMVQNLQLTIQNKSATTLSLTIHESSETIEPINVESTNFTITQSDTKMVLEVADPDGDTIFSTSKGALIASENYWEWSFQFSNGTLFGLDRNSIELEPSEALTKVIYKNRLDHLTQPILWAHQNGKFHGALFRNEGPLEIQILSSNMVILRSLLGGKLEVELFLGPTPADLYRSQTEEVTVPPLWFLGTHHCRKGDSMILSELLAAYAANDVSDFDTDCFHENLFLALQNSSKLKQDVEEVQDYINESIKGGRKFLLSLPPHILNDAGNELYQTAQKLDVLYKYQSGLIYNGTYLGQKVVFPDFSNETIRQYNEVLINWLETVLKVDSFSGFVMNDNWPQDESYENVEKGDFPYYSSAIEDQMQYTLPWTVQGTDKVLHLKKHNSYGEFQNSSLHAYLKSWSSEEPLIASSTKQYGNTEPVISDHLDTTWDNFRIYLNKILFSSITGNRLVGLPICGDTASYNKTLHEALCIRWYIAAATMPYFRVSSGDVFRDPANLNSQFAANIVRAAMERRKLLQDYYYTLLQNPAPLVRPMYYDYFKNNVTFSMEGQYTIGSELIVAHPLSVGKNKLQVFLPKEKAVWYEFWGGTMFAPQEDSEYFDIDALESDWTMLVAQGNIIPLTKSTTVELIIALNCTSKENCQANGSLLKDKNLLKFSATKTEVTVDGLPADCDYTLRYVSVYGYQNYTNGYSGLYEKNLELCNGNGNITIKYSDEVLWS
ncbi:probable alpha-glucosidase Os06g0675700 [Dendroctonus ponderosae]|uniref:probable alpha-glucosidase Os06g0675700 n=1 Tax=Dendroctonus ponderosae TaxID=77166 RepID=UPI002035CE8C|nr:probable alpha-glucosidase Os06g0675700 [Dendroctonus ponderosae]XP_019762424.2 probable alpha-glucosidase Os06g0675700 [Dendroctonus ponderosae]KAH1012468.1 hypothetical protein HUJ05_011624 [Dendroctonus ponderosae]